MDRTLLHALLASYGVLFLLGIGAKRCIGSHVSQLFGERLYAD